MKAIIVIVFCYAVAAARADTRLLELNHEKPSQSYFHGDGSESIVTLNCRATDFSVTLNGPSNVAYSSITSTRGGSPCGTSTRDIGDDEYVGSLVNPGDYDEPHRRLTRSLRANNLLILTGSKDICLTTSGSTDAVGCSTHKGRVLVVEHLSTREPTINLVSHTYVDVDCCLRPSPSSTTVEVTNVPDSTELEACKNATFEVKQIEACEGNFVAWEVTASNGEWTDKSVGWMVESWTVDNGAQSALIFSQRSSNIKNGVSQNPRYPQITASLVDGTPNYSYTFDVHYFLPTGATKLVINGSVRFCDQKGETSLDPCPKYPSRPICVARRAGDFTLMDFVEKKVTFGEVKVNHEL